MLNSFSCVQLFVTLDIVAHQTPLLLAVFQVRILEWVAIPFSRGFSQPKYWTQVYLYFRQILYGLSHNRRIIFCQEKSLITFGAWLAKDLSQVTLMHSLYLRSGNKPKREFCLCYLTNSFGIVTFLMVYLYPRYWYEWMVLKTYYQ